MIGRSIALFVAAAVAEIGGAYLMWQAIKEGRGLLFALAGAALLAGYGAVAALQPDAHFGRVLTADRTLAGRGSPITGPCRRAPRVEHRPEDAGDLRPALVRDPAVSLAAAG